MNTDLVALRKTAFDATIELEGTAVCTQEDLVDFGFEPLTDGYWRDPDVDYYYAYHPQAKLATFVAGSAQAWKDYLCH